MIAGERGPFAGKPRPWLIVQRDAFLESPSSVTVCAITTANVESDFRIPILPSETNGLQHPSRVAVDKIVTIKFDSIDRVAGMVDASTMTLVDGALRLWLDL